MRSLSISAFGWLVVLAVGCSTAGAPPPLQIPPTAVKLAVVQESDIQDASEYVGVLKSLRSTAIQSQVEGQIAAIHVQSGERVKAGARLVQIDPQRQRATVTSQDADRASQEAAVALAQQDLDRVKALHDAELASRQQLDQAENALRRARAELDSLRAKLTEEQVRLQYFTVSAPVDGVVGDVPVRVGEMITPQTVLTTVDDNTVLELHVPTPVERSKDLRLGLPLEVLGSDASVVATATATFISPRVDDTTQSVLVKGLIRGPGAGLRSAQQVRTRVVWKISKGVTAPVLSVIRLSGQYFIFVAEEKDGKLTARQRPIQVGAIVGDSYIVTHGLKPGERIVVEGAQKTADGAPIADQS